MATDILKKFESLSSNETKQVKELGAGMCSSTIHEFEKALHEQSNEKIDFLVKESSEYLKDTTKGHFFTFLRIAMLHRNGYAVAQLLTIRPDVATWELEFAYEHGQSPIIFALSQGKQAVPIYEILSEHNASCELIDPKHPLLVHAGISVKEYMKKHPKGMSRSVSLVDCFDFERAIQKEDIGTIKLLIKELEQDLTHPVHTFSFNKLLNIALKSNNETARQAVKRLYDLRMDAMLAEVDKVALGRLLQQQLSTRYFEGGKDIRNMVDNLNTTVRHFNTTIRKDIIPEFTAAICQEALKLHLENLSKVSFTDPVSTTENQSQLAKPECKRGESKEHIESRQLLGSPLLYLRTLSDGVGAGSVDIGSASLVGAMASKSSVGSAGSISSGNGLGLLAGSDLTDKRGFGSRQSQGSPLPFLKAFTGAAVGAGAASSSGAAGAVSSISDSDSEFSRDLELLAGRDFEFSTDENALGFLEHELEFGLLQEGDIADRETEAALIESVRAMSIDRKQNIDEKAKTQAVASLAGVGKRYGRESSKNNGEKKSKRRRKR